MKSKLIFWLVFITMICILTGRFMQKQETEKVRIKSSTLQLIERLEGAIPQAYRDSQGNWTIGIGHKIKDNEVYLLFATLSKKDMYDLLRRDLKPCETFLLRDLTHPITQGQFDALMSFCHNIGVDNMVRSHTIRYLQSGHEEKAARAMLNWDRPAEIKNRRKQEVKVFLSGA